MRQSIDQYGQKQTQGSVHLWADQLELDPRLANILGSLHAPKDHDFEPLKQSLRRCVLRVNKINETLGSLIVKGFPLQKIESRLKYERYGLAEASNYLQAHSLEIPIPACYGYFEQRSWGTVKANGVLIEDLQGYSTLHDLAEKSPDLKSQIHAKALPLINDLYSKGVNHIDTTAHNFMESPDDGKLVVIDWQYASFVTPKDVKQLILQAVQFLRYTEMKPSDDDWQTWLKELYDLSAPDMEWPRFSENVSLLQAEKRAPNKSRLTLTVELPA